MDDFEGLAGVGRDAGLAGSAAVRGAADDGEFLLGACGPGGDGGTGRGFEVGEVAFAGEVGTGVFEGVGHVEVFGGGEVVGLATEWWWG